jgi:hypothetical protein
VRVTRLRGFARHLWAGFLNRQRAAASIRAMAGQARRAPAFGCLGTIKESRP